MLNITKFSCENIEHGCVTDQENPAFSFKLDSDIPNTKLNQATLTVNGWQITTEEQIAIIYQGAPLKPFTIYQAKLQVEDNHGQLAEKILTFETGRLKTAWDGKWITDGNYHFTEKKVSPIPMLFQKKIKIEKQIKSAKIYSTALGIYYFMLNGQRVGKDYFAPGFTSYKTNLQYQVYDISSMLGSENELNAIVAGGWAVGSFVMTRANRITAKRQALLAELRIEYTDGSVETISTDESWNVTIDNAFLMADLYDGETFDARLSSNQNALHAATIENVKIRPRITATYGALVKPQEIMKPIQQTKLKNEIIYDFGQNFAGVIHLNIKNANEGQKIVVRHAEILQSDGSLNTTFLRTAKATATYICKEGNQTYTPTLTYMGFRYASIEGIEPENIEVQAFALYSDIEQIGYFETSNPLINQLQSNIVWSSKSNFVDIPTDCPQRDERMGWTGDIAVFAPTANFNFDMSRFINKWLIDVKNEQLPTGGIPNSVPAQSFGFPETMPTMAIDFWGDACVLVPWEEYVARGDIRVLKEFYPMMKKYVNACKFWAELFSFGKQRFIWHTPSILHFGDWVAPDVPKMSQWQKRSRWTATASLRNTSQKVAKIAEILGNKEDASYYQNLSNQTADAYETILTDGNGKLFEEFQTAYVLPIHYQMFKPENQNRAVENLVKLIKDNQYCIGTGFPGTPYLLFALSDSGRSDIAYKMLLNTVCPSWLYQVKMGATTIWERWDGLDEDGNCPIGDDGTDMMISYNHYASGAVGDFMYKRIAGIEPTMPGYRRFKVEPVIGGGLTFTKAALETPFGLIESNWQIANKQVQITVRVPVGTECEVCYQGRVYGNFAHGLHKITIPL